MAHLYILLFLGVYNSFLVSTGNNEFFVAFYNPSWCIRKIQPEKEQYNHLFLSNSIKINLKRMLRLLVKSNPFLGSQLN